MAGIDVSKDKLDVHVEADGGDFTVCRDARGLADLSKRLRKAGVGEVGLEASGGYERSVLEHLEKDGFVVHLLDPARVRHFAEAAGILAKTDAIDARVIAGYCRHFPEAGLTRKPENARKLSEYLTVRSMLLKIVDEARNRLEHLREAALKAIAEQVIVDAKGRLKEIEAGIARVIAEDEAMKLKARRIRSLMGAGPVLTANLLAYLPELGSIDRRQAARLAGTAPADKKSGKSSRRSRVAGGRDNLRPILYMAALAAMRSNPAISAFAKRLSAAGKAKLVVISACARKIIVILNAMLREQTMWQNPKVA